MRTFDVLEKPSVTPMYDGVWRDTNDITHMPNIISKEVADDLIRLGTSDPGWHRRGSKNPFCHASFSTCLLHDTTNVIYDIIDKVWCDYLKRIYAPITFVEQYEIKSYSTGDEFEWHVDSYMPINDNDRLINLVIQLSDDNDYEGGDLVVRRGNESVRTDRAVGSGIIFPAHLYHKVTPVTSGTRFSLICHAWGPSGR